ncbi:uncharacterized protein LOC106460150 isoform X3 [Limulus polyphemus]|uniref:Uncharacterized protein LOC106460150 isoform X3 n=1 Tax=Limulus polyphemus TaxID=6850 RepID=A0ABM1SFV1_LIMPO|nr:uncharacterized protein LOC106460150 isoform X3 [Limulus polyphemus]
MQLGELLVVASLFVTLAFFCSRTETRLVQTARNSKIPRKNRMAIITANITGEDEDMSSQEKLLFRSRRDETVMAKSAYGRGVAFFIGEPCEHTCNDILYNIYCNLTSKKCECLKEYPAIVDNKFCVKGARLWERCEHTESCSYYNDHAICNSGGECRCEEGYKSHSDATGEMCIPGKGDGILENPDIMTVIMVVSGVMIGTALFCLVLRLFSRARFGRNRGRFGNAAAPPVVLTGTEAPASIPCSRRPSRSSASNEYLPGSRSASVHSHASVRSYATIKSQSPVHNSRGNREKVNVRRTASSPPDVHQSLPSLNHLDPNSTCEDPKTEPSIPEEMTTKKTIPNSE